MKELALAINDGEYQKQTLYNENVILYLYKKIYKL